LKKTDSVKAVNTKQKINIVKIIVWGLLILLSHNLSVEALELELASHRGVVNLGNHLLAFLIIGSALSGDLQANSVRDMANTVFPQLDIERGKNGDLVHLHFPLGKRLDFTDGACGSLLRVKALQGTVQVECINLLDWVKRLLLLDRLWLDVAHSVEKEKKLKKKDCVWKGG